MNRAIWKKAVAEAWLQLAICSLILVLFGWAFVWLMSLLGLQNWAGLLKFVPRGLMPLMGVEPSALATVNGQLSVALMHLVTLLVSVGWALGRGSASVSGEIGRGTMDLVLSLPIRRATVILAPGVVAAAGGAVLAGSLLVGIALGLTTVAMPEEASVWPLLPGAVNLACMIFCFTGVTALVSSVNSTRWRTIILAGGVYVVSLFIKIVWRMWDGGWWLKYSSFLCAYQPQKLVLEPEAIDRWGLWYNLPLIGVGLAAYLVAVAAFTYRDIPAAK